MKKQLLFTRMLLLVALLVGSTSMWADDTYVKVTSASDLVADGEYILLETSTNTKYLANTTYSSSKYGSVTSGFSINGNTVTVTTGTAALVLKLGGSAGAWTLYDVNSKKWIGKHTTSNTNFIQTTNESDLTNSQYKWTIKTKDNEYAIYSNYSSYTGRYWGRNSAAIGPYSGADYPACVLYKKSTATPHTLTFSATGGNITATNATTGATVTTGASVAEGTTLNIVAAPNSGYVFTGWSSSPSATFGNASNASTTYVMPTANATLTANFEVDDTDYDITLNQTSGGTIEASATTAKSGTQITLTPTPDSGYRLVSWTVLDGDANEVTVTNNKFTMPASDVEVEGTFAREYTITINDAEHGSVTADPVAGIEDETITLTITPDANYSLNTISVKDADEGDVALSGTGNTRTFTMPAKAVTVTATFNIPKGSFANPYTVDEIIGSSISGNKYVIGYIVGDLSNNTSSVNTKSFADSNLALATTPAANSTTFNNRNDVIVVELPNDITRVNNKMSTHTYLIGKEAIVYGSVQDYFGRKGVKSTKLILTNNVMTLKSFGESSTSDIPGYSADGNILYYTNSNVTGKNIIKEESGGSCSTTSAIKITEGEPFRVLSDVTVPSIENSRVILAAEDAYTWYEPYNYTLAVEKGTAYSFTGVSGSTLQFTATGSTTLTANTPYLIVPKADVDASVATTVTLKATPAADTESGEYGDWTFKGTYTGMTAAEAAAANVYGLNAGNKWLYFTGSEGFGMPPFRAYMVNASGHAKIMESILDTDTKEEQEVTAIELINKDGSENRIYTLDGKYVGTKSEVLSKGMYIVNGKKFVVK